MSTLIPLITLGSPWHFSFNYSGVGFGLLPLIIRGPLLPVTLIIRGWRFSFKNIKKHRFPKTSKILKGRLPPEDGSDWRETLGKRVSDLQKRSSESMFCSFSFFLEKKSPKNDLGCRRMKCRKSSETRFPKVSRQSEPCSRGKRPIEVSKKKSKFVG